MEIVSGIYILRFNGTEQVYIGQATNIYRRFNEHKRSMRNETCNYKLLGAYKKYGNPILEILIVADKLELNNLETEAISIFDSVNNGFNILDTATQGIKEGYPGDTNPNSKYSNDQIEEVFLLLYEGNLTHKEISKIANVSTRVIERISEGTGHTWLKNKFPDIYCEFLERKIRKYPQIKDPEGNTYTVENISEFARKHGLSNSCLGCVLRRKRLHHRGWTLV